MADAEQQYKDTLVQYVVLRKDLLKVASMPCCLPPAKVWTGNSLEGSCHRVVCLQCVVSTHPEREPPETPPRGVTPACTLCRRRTTGTWGAWSRKDATSSARCFFFFFFTLVTGPRRSLSLKLSDTRVCEPQIRARVTFLSTFCLLECCFRGLHLFTCVCPPQEGRT